jgi:cysteine desulfurase/selenocysteine lyase
MYNAQDFPQLDYLKKESLTYLDSAATSLKHSYSVNEEYRFNTQAVSNVHRGTHRLSARATDEFEAARRKTAKHLNVSPEQVVFTKGTTDSINLVAHHFEETLNSEDAILITEMEHHANLVPWQRVAKKTGAKLLYIPVNKIGELDLEKAKELFSLHKIKILSVVHISNTLGTLNPVDELIQLAHNNKSKVLIDGAQSFTTHKPDLNKMNCDFYTFSAHKAFGPFGLGVLYIKNPDQTEAYQLGGAMIQEVQFEDSSYLSGSLKFETGTPNISSVLAFSKTLDFIETLDSEAIQNHEIKLLKMAQEALSGLEGFNEFGKSDTKVGILSFYFDGIHSNDLCELLDEQGLALRSGHHCTQPLLRKFGLSSCARASFSIYNTEEDVEKLITATKKSLEMLR